MFLNPMIHNPMIIILMCHNPVILNPMIFILHSKPPDPKPVYPFYRYPVHALDLNAICSSPAPPEEIITAAKREAKRNAPAILYIPSISRIWEALGPVGQAALFHAMDDVAFEGQSSRY